MAHIIPKLQENKEKTRNYLNLPRKLIEFLGWKKGDEIRFEFNSLYAKEINKSQITLVNIKLYKAMNPALALIEEESKKWSKIIKNINSLSTKISLEKWNNLTEEKTFPKIEFEKIPKEAQINHFEGRRRAFKMDLKEISRQIKNLKRRN